MSPTSDHLYESEELYRLLPVLYRIRDLDHDGVLRELTDVLTEQVNALAESLEQMYDDQFIETAAEWVAPYLGDLIGYRPLHGVVPKVASPRAEVANTIRYRRRKGTASVLEQLARDVTGWPARVVEMFELLCTSQYMNHVRPHAAATASMRAAIQLEQLGPDQAGAFDGLAHTAEMRRIPGRGGRYNIPNIALFLWRVQAMRLARSPLAAVDGAGLRFRFDPLGTESPLFGAARTETDITHLAEPLDVPLPLSRRWLDRHLAEYYGRGRSLLLEVESPAGVAAVPVGEVRICDLSDDPASPGTWAHAPLPGDAHVAVDPVLGRVAFAVAPAAGETRLATFHYGAALSVGGGGYERVPGIVGFDNVHLVSAGASLAAALAAAGGSGGAIHITDSYRYAMPPSISVTTPAPAAPDPSMAIIAANRARPLLVRNGALKLAMQPDTTVVLDGVVVAGGPLVIEESADTRPRTLVLRHCTLVPGVTRTAGGAPGSPGAASLIVLHPFTTVTFDHCIVGPIVAVEGATVTINDSVIDASDETAIAFAGRAKVGGGLRTVTTAADRQTGDGLVAGGHLTLEACTVIGTMHAERFDVSNSLMLAARTGPADPWPAPVWAQRRQVGCIRFSFVPAGSRTPRRFSCVSADTAGPAIVAHLTSRRYGDPAYGQLQRSTPDEIRMGASDESEMGVTHELYAPQRESNLRLRMDEYLRFGLEAGFFYAT